MAPCRNISQTDIKKGIQVWVLSVPNMYARLFGRSLAKSSWCMHWGQKEPKLVVYPFLMYACDMSVLCS